MRNGVPGADSAPRVMAMTRSSVPNAVQAASSHRGNLPLQPATAASGIAARPVVMSPQPAEIANGAARRPWWCRIKKLTPAIRKALTPMSAQSGMDRSALRKACHADQATRPPISKIKNGITGAGNEPVTPGANPPRAPMVKMREIQAAAITNATTFAAGRMTANPTSTAMSAAQIAPNNRAPITSNNIKPPFCCERKPEPWRRQLAGSFRSFQSRPIVLMCNCLGQIVAELHEFIPTVSAQFFLHDGLHLLPVWERPPKLRSSAARQLDSPFPAVLAALT